MISNLLPSAGGRRRQKSGAWMTLLALLVAVSMLAPVPAVPRANALGPDVATLAMTSSQAAPAAAAQATTDTITLRVISARTEPLALDGAGVNEGDPVTSYKWMINEDNTGDPFDDTDCWAYLDPPANTIRNPNYPDGCDWPGVHSTPGWSPIVTQGTEADLNETQGVTLPPGKYLISVQGDGFKVDGEHFTVPMDVPGLITVAAHPLPLPTSSMVIQVFNDNSMTNGQFDAPVEQPGPGPTSMACFRVSLNDIAGEITTDLFGNPLCTEYEKDPVTGDVLLDADGMPANIVQLGGECLSDDYGIINIPNIGAMRYDVLVTPPDGETWIQTTTLEGSHGWDTWIQEAGTGLDNEFIVAGEPFPWTIFGFVKPSEATLPPIPDGGSITGVVAGITAYTPSAGGLPHQGDLWGGLLGVKIEEPIAYPWLSLSSLQGGDTAIWTGMGNEDGSFRIDNIPPGDYFLAYWDFNQHYILDFVQVPVQAGEVTDVGVRTMTNWFTKWHGKVFLDYNENGRMDPGEPGVPDVTVVLRDRDNTEIDRMSIASVSDATGDWALEKGYPMSSWMVLEAYSDIYRTTGVTYQASNAKEETTLLGPIVDLAVLPIFSQAGRLDWGVKFYDPGTNGGIAGTVFYDTVRAEDDAAYAGAEPWQPGIPGLTLQLWEPVECPGPAANCDPTGRYLLADDGSIAKGALLNETVTEDWVRPKDCQPLDVYGDPVDYPSMPPSTGGYDCLEGPPMGVQFGHGQQELPGNYGFSEIFTPSLEAAGAYSIPIPTGDYLVEVVIPDDPILNRPLYQVTREEDLNIFDGDTFIPQVVPPACAGPLHVVDVAGIAPDGPNAVDNPGFADAGGSRFEGEEKPLCNVKLVTVADRKGIAPIFNLWTPVPIPGRWRGYIIDDLNVSTNPLELFFGEKAGMPNSPIGIYDYTGRMVHTVHSDFHGVYEVILPSDATYNAPAPSGMLASVYYIYGNDPGQPGAFNDNYNPAYRSIGTSFEVYPGVIVPSDLAPTQNGALIWNPASNVSQIAQCTLDDTTPQIFAVDQPYVMNTGTITVRGKGFGATQGTGPTAGFVRLSGWQMSIVSWSDTEIVFNVPANTPAGPRQLEIRNSAGRREVNALTIHILDVGYQPNIYEVGVGKTYDPSDPVYTGENRGPIQHAIDDAAASPGDDVVVVYPGLSEPFTNPLGFYLENPVIYAPVKLQGVGPGGVYPDGTNVPGSILDGRGMGGTEVYAGWWRENVGDIWENRGGWDGSPVDGDGLPQMYEGQVITVLAEQGEFGFTYRAAIDGFKIQGGDQQGFPNNLNQVGGEQIPGVAPEVVIQGGGIWVNAYARGMQISNNIIENNGGAYAGGIRIGTPDLPEPYKDGQNDFIIITKNRLVGNGGTNLAGAIGIFAGADGYTVSNNDICGNFSAEYGGGISHYGYSPNGRIRNNRIYFNRSYDEGGGIMIAGELPIDPSILSPGAGPVEVSGNLIQANLANDDGGGLRFLMAGNYPFNVFNNMIVNNVSTHEGGGVSLNDAPDVRFYNNTVMKNITTATAMTSNGLAAPAGLASSKNSNLLQATLPAGSPEFSDALMFNNIFWDNRAGTWTGGGVAGIGLPGDPSPIFYWDLGVAGDFGELSPTYTLMQVQNGIPHASNIVGQDPLVVSVYDTSVRVFPWRGNPAFVGALIVAVELPVNLLGDYHLTANSPAYNAGTAEAGGVLAPNSDYDLNARPAFGLFDIGADEMVQPFPATPVLFPAQAAGALRAASEPRQDAPYKLWLPFVTTIGGALEGTWTGQLDSFEFDDVTGVTALNSGYVFWDTLFGLDQEVRFTFTSVSDTATRQDLLLKVGGVPDGIIGDQAHLVAVGYDATTGALEVRTMSPGQVWTTHATFGGHPFSVGDTFGARVTRGGFVEVYVNGQVFGHADLTAGDAPWAYAAEAGLIGFWFEAPALDREASAGFTDFGGGSLP
ncbi:MAG: hypothetical protein GX597_27755 [Anaerolineaceae bacterium]|nr:hypothetical protein [Anaerolineaceae bacterium]